LSSVPRAKRGRPPAVVKGFGDPRPLLLAPPLGRGGDTDAGCRRGGGRIGHRLPAGHPSTGWSRRGFLSGRFTARSSRHQARRRRGRGARGLDHNGHQAPPRPCRAHRDASRGDSGCIAPCPIVTPAIGTNKISGLGALIDVALPTVLPVATRQRLARRSTMFRNASSGFTGSPSPGELGADFYRRCLACLCAEGGLPHPHDDPALRISCDPARA